MPVKDQQTHQIDQTSSCWEPVGIYYIWLVIDISTLCSMVRQTKYY
jgi:hypothetical protein